MHICVGCGTNPVFTEDATCSDECYLDVFGELPPEEDEDK